MIAFLLATLALLPAQAAVRATYRVVGVSQPVIVEMDDEGAVRLGTETEEGPHLVMRDGVAYVVGESDAGKPVVAALRDVIAGVLRVRSAVAELAEDMADTPPLPPPFPLVIERRDPRTIAGVPGTRMVVRAADRRSTLMDVVIADEARLRPIAVAMKQTLGQLIGLADVLPPASANAFRWIRQFDAVFDAGMPLIFTDVLMLTEFVSTADIPAARTALPAAPMPRAEIVKLLRERATAD